MTKPTLEEQILAFKMIMRGDPVDEDILASLRELAAIKSQPVPVEPDVVKRIRIAGQSDTLLSVIEYIDALKAKLQAAQQELLDTTWQDHADHWKKRAEQAEKDRDACYASLEATRSKLHEITAFVNDNASPQRESEQERDAFARAIRERSAK